MPAGNSLQVTQGTQNNVAADQVGGASGTYYPYVRMDVGTFNAGTVTSQINSVPFVVGTSYGTFGTTGAAAWGTLVSAAGVGTKQYVSGIDISGISGTAEIVVSNVGVSGSQGNGVLARFNTVPGGGLSKVFNPVQASATNGTLAFWMGAAGTVDIVIQYWQGV